MQVINCPRCRRLFNKTVSSVCPECVKVEEDQFESLKKFLEEHPMSNIHVTSEATGVSPKRILHYIREGRLVVPEGMIGDIRCKKCDEPVSSGNYCEPCSAKMANELADSIGITTNSKRSGASNRKGVGMHTMQTWKK